MMLFIRFVGLAVLFVFFIDCKQSRFPKPKGYLALEYPIPVYHSFDGSPNYSFDYNAIAQPIVSSFESLQVYYPLMKATIYINYRKVENNLDSLLHDAYLIPYRHVSKAEEIPEKVFINHDQRVYGQLFSVIGNAASQQQFFLTDSTHHFILGSLYFYALPNYDSIYPAIKYIESDIMRMMASFQWN
ncbi:MAG: gliding motility lipoprotein GldD [Flavobacteriaceae bacterium]|nr:gliding motility lipoprotein GldD [Flavobacteriaceae bacterium]